MRNLFKENFFILLLPGIILLNLSSSTAVIPDELASYAVRMLLTVIVLALFAARLVIWLQDRAARKQAERAAERTADGE